MPYCSMVLIFAYIFFFSSGPGTSTRFSAVQSASQTRVCGSVVSKILLWILSSTAGVTAPLPGEIFTQSYKPPAFMVACILNWVGLFLVGMLFPLIVVRWSASIILWPIFCLEFTHSKMLHHLKKMSNVISHEMKTLLILVALLKTFLFYMKWVSLWRLPSLDHMTSLILLNFIWLLLLLPFTWRKDSLWINVNSAFHQWNLKLKGAFTYTHTTRCQ